MPLRLNNPRVALVAVQLLNPFDVDDRHDADEQTDVLRYVDFVGYHRAVQALVEQQVGVLRNVFPGSERPGFLRERTGFPPSRKLAVTPSRRKICSNVRITEVVPAPDDPVMATIGCLTATASLQDQPAARNSPRMPNRGASKSRRLR